MNAIAKDIYEAAVYGDVAVVKRLLKSATFADLIYKNPNDLHKTAVMVAAYHGHTEIVRAIFKHSIASVHMQDEEGWTALMFAAFRGHTSTINAILLHPEVDANVKNNHGWTALMLAAAQGHSTAVRSLLTRADIDVNAQNNQDGGTALLHACLKGHTEIVRDMLSLKGVQISLQDKEGRKAADVAKNDEIVSLLNFYDPVQGLVYPVPDLPLPPRHNIVMPPMPPAHEPKLALSAEYQQCHLEVTALLALLPSIQERGSWHQRLVALQRKMQSAVHIHQHKEAALIGREFLAHKATTASTAALRALSEQDYLHLPEQVALLQQRLASLCAALARAKDSNTLKKAEELVKGLNDLQKALDESAVPPANMSRAPSPQSLRAPSPPSLPERSVTSPRSPRTSRPTSRAASPESVHAKVQFSESIGEGEGGARASLGGEEGDDGNEMLMPPPPPPHNTPAYVGKRSDTTEGDAMPRDRLADNIITLASPPKSASNSARSSPKHTITATISAIPELDYLPHYSAYSNTVPSGAFELHETAKSFEDLMREKNRSHAHDMPPPPPPGGV